MKYGNGQLIDHVLHMRETRDVFQALQADSVDAAFVDVRTFDAWRGAHGSGGLALSGYVHSLAFNMGFVALASNMALINQANSILADLQAHDAIAPMAASAGLTFMPPRTPAVRPFARAPSAGINDAPVSSSRRVSRPVPRACAYARTGAAILFPG